MAEDLHGRRLYVLEEDDGLESVEFPRFAGHGWAFGSCYLISDVGMRAAKRRGWPGVDESSVLVVGG